MRRARSPVAAPHADAYDSNEILIQLDGHADIEYYIQKAKAYLVLYFDF